MKHAIIHTDGGARGNPGPSGIGVVVQYDGKKVKYKKYIGTATNNQAEYQAIIFALEIAKQLNIESIDFFLDSELVCQQLNLKYKIKEQNLAKLFIKAWNMMPFFKKVAFRHIMRGDNTEADRLVNLAINEKIKKRS